MRYFLPLVFALSLCGAGAAAPVAAPVKAEIDGLLSRLQRSGCEFNRNGSWYSGAQAKTHLLRKLDYLEGKNLVPTTEKFIELGATASSSSGTLYLVRCGSAAQQESSKWLMQELKAIRASRTPAASNAK